MNKTAQRIGFIVGFIVLLMVVVAGFHDHAPLSVILLASMMCGGCSGFVVALGVHIFSKDE